MCDQQQFISGADVSDDDLRDYDAGTLVAWRRGPDGTQWYRRSVPAPPSEFPLIRGVGEPVGLDDYEKRSLEQWAAQLRQLAGNESDPDEDDDDAADE